jgi:hypothetical protein
VDKQIKRLLGEHPIPGPGAEREALPAQPGWQLLAVVTLEGGVGRSTLQFHPVRSIQYIKLHSLRGDVEVYRCTLLFEDDTRQELSINCLFQGEESGGIMIAGRRLKGMVLEYDTPKATRRGRLEVLALF